MNNFPPAWNTPSSRANVVPPSFCPCLYTPLLSVVFGEWARCGSAMGTHFTAKVEPGATCFRTSGRPTATSMSSFPPSASLPGVFGVKR